MRVRDLLSFYEFDGDNTPVVQGSALGALNGEDHGYCKGINDSS